MGSGKAKRRLVVGAVLVVGYAVGTVVAVRRGYSFGVNTVVRCGRGHLFSTVWIPGASVKALRLGPWRVQWCPVGRHVALVHPVKASELSDGEREAALARRDVRVP